MFARLLAWLPLLLWGCAGTDRIAYEGTPGASTPAVFDAWIPGVGVSANGDGERQFWVDTGAPLTALFRGAYSALAAGTTTTDFDAFGLHFPALPVAVLDTGVGGTGGCQSTALGGLIGHDLLGHFRLGIDYQGQRVFLFDGPASGDRTISQGQQPAQLAPFELDGGGTLSILGTDQRVAIGPSRIVVEPKIEDLSLSAMVDTGATLVTISQRLFDRLSGADRPRLCCTDVAFIDRNVKAELVRLRELSIGAARAENVPALVLPDREVFDALSQETGREIEMLIGGSFLRQFAVEVDYPARQLALGRYHDPSHLDEDEFVLPGFSFCKAADPSQGMLVLNVFEGSDAAKQGLRDGLSLLAIDGQSTIDATFDEALARIRAHAVGSTVKLTFPADLENTTLDLDVMVERLLPDYR